MSSSATQATGSAIVMEPNVRMATNEGTGNFSALGPGVIEILVVLYELGGKHRHDTLSGNCWDRTSQRGVSFRMQDAVILRVLALVGL